MHSPALTRDFLKTASYQLERGPVAGCYLLTPDEQSRVLVINDRMLASLDARLPEAVRYLVDYTAYVFSGFVQKTLSLWDTPRIPLGAPDLVLGEILWIEPDQLAGNYVMGAWAWKVDTTNNVPVVTGQTYVDDLEFVSWIDHYYPGSLARLSALPVLDMDATDAVTFVLGTMTVPALALPQDVTHNLTTDQDTIGTN